MQYAIIKIEDRDILIDASEYTYLQTSHNQEAIIDSLYDEESDEIQLHVCYGAYIPNTWGESPEEITEFFLEKKDFSYTFLNWKTQVFQEFGVVDIVYLPSSRSFFQHHVAVLIQSNLDLKDILPPNSSITSFLTFSNMEPMSNILNRYGVLAIKAVEKRIITDKITRGNWKTFVDPERLEKLMNLVR